MYSVQMRENTERKLTIPETFFPVDTGHKLNVLCTFNLRPASTGLLVGKKKINYKLILRKF